MPQGQRKVPFSHKRKKQQLNEKKQAKAGGQRFLIRKVNESDTDDTEISEDLQHQIGTADALATKIQKINLQKNKDPRSKSNRYALQFQRESNSELKEMKEQARKPLKYATQEDLEVNDDCFEGYEFPVRPNWTYEMSKEQVEANEQRYFFQFVTKLEKLHYDDMKQLSFFELNLETWRQLWRVLELSDILLMVVDIRFPTFLFPPFTYEYVVNKLNKNLILVLNKVDLVDASLVLAWKHYFEEKYPQIKVILFTSYPNSWKNSKGLTIRQHRGRRRMAVEGAQQVYQVVSEIVNDAVDLSSWKDKIAEELILANNATISDDVDEDKLIIETTKTHEEEKVFEFEEIVKFKNGVVTIGMVGFPNVGKSSLLNALMGRKVVSVSRTPGHTKHFQTIFITNNVKLVDVPGTTFPSRTNKQLQVLIGSYPIAQLREPYGAIKFLAERIDLVKLLSLQHPEEGSNEWSAIDICEAWARKRGFFTAKAARPDTYRAANSILRYALDGKLTLSFYPPNYVKNIEHFKKHPELAFVERIQAHQNINFKTQANASNGSEIDETDESEENSSSEDTQLPSSSNQFALLDTSL